jgi:undecaprenyl-diphosphatase
MPADLQIFEAVILGAVQGLTEFLPISSSAHLLLVPWILGWRDPGLAFDVALHVGSLLAAVIFFRQQWFELIRSLFRRGDTKNHLLLVALAIGTLPGAVAGYVGDTWVNDTFHAGNRFWIVGAVMAVVGLTLYLADRIGHKVRPLSTVSLVDAILIGAAQALALVPGVSRSGATMTAGLLLGLEREAAARFSFLLATPIIAGAGLKASLDLVHAPDPVPWMAVGAGTVSAFVVGILAIAFLLRWLERGTFLPFALYRLILGGCIVALHFMAGQ